LTEWSNRKSLNNSKFGELGKGVQAFRCDNFSAEDVKFDHFSNNILFRFRHSESRDYLINTMFLVKILQSQAKSDGCWFFNEKLSDYQQYLRCYLEASRREGFVRKFRISNQSNWFQIKTSNLSTERPIHLLEPRAQLLDHTHMSDHTPSKNQFDWDVVANINNIKNRKNKIRAYWDFGTRFLLLIYFWFSNPRKSFPIITKINVGTLCLEASMLLIKTVTNKIRINVKIQSPVTKITKIKKVTTKIKWLLQNNFKQKVPKI